MNPRSPDRFIGRKQMLSPLKSTKRKLTNEHSHHRVSVLSRSTFKQSLHFIGSYLDRTSEIFDKLIPDNTQKELEITVEELKEPEFYDDLIVEKQQGYGFFASLLIFLKMNIVSSFLFLPIVFNKSGWLFGSITVIIYISAYAYSSISLSNCTIISNFYNYTENADLAFGKPFKYIFEGIICLLQCCFPVTYVNITVTIINKVIKDLSHSNNDYYWYIFLCEVVVFVPLCFFRNIKTFAKLHLLGDISVMITVVALIYYSIHTIHDNKNFDIDNYSLVTSKWAEVVGTMGCMIEGTCTLLPIKEGMKDKTQFNKVIIIGCSIVATILITISVIPVFSFGNNINQIVVLVLPFDKLYSKVVLIFLVFSIVVVYPVAVRPAFKIIENYLKCKKHITLIENSIRTLIVIITSCLGVIFVDSFGKLLIIAGCVICIPISIIIPNLIHFKIFKNKQSMLRNIIDLAVSSIGLTTSLTVLTFVLIIK